MSDRQRFGPAGFPKEFKELNRPREEVPKYLLNCATACSSTLAVTVLGRLTQQ